MEYNTYHRYYKVTIELRPSEIKFTQDSVAMCFKDGHDLNETCKDIAVGNLQVNQLPKIRVILQNGIYYSSDNRRLYIFRVLERLGFLKKIYVFEVKQTNRDITTENGGCHIKIRNRPDTSGDWTEWKFATIYRHCPCPYAWKGREIPDWWDSNRKCHRNIKGIVPNPYLAIDDVTKVPQNNKIRKFKPQTTKEEKISKSSTNNASMKKVRETNLSRGEPTQETNATNCSYIFVNTNKCNMNIDTNTTLKICQNNSMEAENEEFPKNSYKYYFIAVGAAVAIGSLYYHTTYKLRPSSKPMVPSSNASSLLSKKVSKTRSWLTSWWSGTKSPTEYASVFSTVVSSSVNHLSEKLKSERNIAQTVSGTMENLTNLASSWSGTKSPTEYASGFSSAVSGSVNHLSEKLKSERNIAQTVSGTMENLTNLASSWSGTKSPTEYASGFSSVVSSSVNHLSEKLKSERNIAQTVSGTMENLTNLASSWSGTKSPTEYASGFSSVVSSSVNRLSEMFKGK